MPQFKNVLASLELIIRARVQNICTTYQDPELFINYMQCFALYLSMEGFFSFSEKQIDREAHYKVTVRVLVIMYVLLTCRMRIAHELLLEIF